MVSSQAESGNSAGKKYNCAGVREELAYAGQGKWFNLFGRNLSTEFESDAFTLNVSTASQ